MSLALVAAGAAYVTLAFAKRLLLKPIMSETSNLQNALSSWTDISSQLAGKTIAVFSDCNLPEYIPGQGIMHLLYCW